MRQEFVCSDSVDWATVTAKMGKEGRRTSSGSMGNLRQHSPAYAPEGPLPPGVYRRDTEEERAGRAPAERNFQRLVYSDVGQWQTCYSDFRKTSATIFY
jgi:hypothetical protein